MPITQAPSWARPRGAGGKFLPQDPQNVKRKKRKAGGQTQPQIPPTQGPAAAPPQTITGLRQKVAFVIDRSGSMSGFRHDVPRVFGQLVRQIREESQRTQVETRVSLMSFDQFSGEVRLQYHYFEEPTIQLRDLQPGEYQPRGGTPLRDAIGDMVDRLRKLPDARDEKTSFLVYVLTDGEENQSQSWSPFHLQELLREVQGTDRWTLAVMCPPQAGKTVQRLLGIPMGNIQEWEQTQEGLETARVQTQSALSSYFTSRSIGTTRSTSFFANLQDPKKVQRELEEVSRDYRHWTVRSGDPEEISEFIRWKGLPYELGRAFYQLVKKEKVQGRKEILLRDKISGLVYGGPRARYLLGLPKGLGAGEIKVQPGDHRNYDIFVQSTSTNRLVGLGSQILYKIS